MPGWVYRLAIEQLPRPEANGVEEEKLPAPQQEERFQEPADFGEQAVPL